MFRIQNLEGLQYARDGPLSSRQDYSYFKEQYASESYAGVEGHELSPSLIVQPKHDGDIVKAVNWAREHKVAVAVRSGGHQYSGASSCGGNNIQLDLTNTYRDMMVLEGTGGVAGLEAVPADRALVLAGVSSQLQDLTAYLGHNGLFVPTGQCAYVCVGGHGQTGGYGQLGRSFGLFGDHIVRIRLVGHDGAVREVTRQSDAELFWAVLGGSPGNFGVITHYTVMAYRAQSYLGSGLSANANGNRGGPRGIKGLWLYDKGVLTKLLQAVAKMSDNGATPRNYDLCVSVLSTDFPVTKLFPSLRDDTLWRKIQNKIRSALADDVLDLLNGQFPAVIVVYAQWCPLSKDDVYDDAVDDWFQQFRDLDNVLTDHALLMDEFDEDMARMTARWIFPKRREFDLPYVKRTYTTASTTLLRDGWPAAVADRLDLIYNPRHGLDHGEGDDEHEVYEHCKLSVQIQAFGGRHSQFSANRDNGTSYSWRDSTVVQTLDCFHDRGDARYRQYAEAWQRDNDAVMVGPASPFSKTDRRVLWGSWGDWHMANKAVWGAYYDDEAKYRRLGRVRGRADPDGTFTANPFAVEAIRPDLEDAVRTDLKDAVRTDLEDAVHD